MSTTTPTDTKQSKGAPKQEKTYSQKPATYLPDTHRSMPASLDAEKGVLCSILLNPIEWIDESVARGLNPDYFYLPAHRTVFDALTKMHDASLPIDFISLTQYLRDRKLLEEVGGAAAITDLGTFVPTAANADYYLDILRDKFLLRNLITTCGEIAARGYEEQDDVKTLIDSAEEKILRVSDTRFTADVPSFPELISDAVARIAARDMRTETIAGLPTGFSNLDQMLDGLHEGEMFVVAARPSVGKTAIALNIACNVALGTNGRDPQPVAIYSLEMSSPQVVERLIASTSGVNLRQKNKKRTRAEQDNILGTVHKLVKAPIYIDDTPSLPIFELRAHARRLHKRHGIKLIVIDYLQLLRSPSRRGQDNRQVEVAEISTGIKALAKELGIPIVVLAQLNRNPDARISTTGKGGASAQGQPRLSDLRESGSIEQDADVVGLLWRKDYYKSDDEEKRQEDEGKAELLIAKNRNGPTGEIHLTFLRECTRFEERAPDYREENN